MTTTRKWAREWSWIFLIGLLVQGFWALRLQHPAYFDAYYYTTNGHRLAQGYGFTEEIIWQYLDNPQSLPTPSHTYWMPLTSIIAAAGYRLGQTFRAAQAPFWLMAALLPLLAYAISWQLYRERWQARTTAFFTMAGGYYTAYWVQPTTFVLFAWTGAGCLLALALARRRRAGRGAGRWWLVAGLAAGLSHLTRADGLLILGAGVLMWLLEAGERWRADHSPPWREGVFLALGYLLIMGPWFYRTWLVSGQPLSTVGTQTIFLTVYDDVFSYGRRIEWRTYLDWGWRNILVSKLEAAWLAIQTYVAVIGLTAFSVFVLWAWIAARGHDARRRFLQPMTVYALVLFVAMSFIFTFPGQRGSLLHSSTALWPWSMALVAGGLDRAVDWIAARRPSWKPQSAKRFFAVSFIAMAFVISFVVAAGQPLRRDEAAVYHRVAQQLPANAVVMTGDPPGFYYHTGRPAIATPNEPPAGMLRAARQFGATYLLMSDEHPAPLNDLYEGDDQDLTLQLIAAFGDGYRLFRLPEASEIGGGRCHRA